MQREKEVILVQVKDTGKGSSREEAQQQAAEKVNIVIIVIMITNNPFLILGILSFTLLSLPTTHPPGVEESASESSRKEDKHNDFKTSHKEDFP